MDKTTLIETLRTEREQWEVLLTQIGEERMVQSGAAGEWSIKDIIAHVMWTERETVGILQHHAFVGSSLWRLPMDERNAAMVAENRDRSLHEVRTEAQQVFEQLVQAIQELPEADLNDASCILGIPPNLLPWQVIARNSYEHYHQHMPSLRAWLEASKV
ncbi:MAG: hypothetical protein NVS4B11_28050 [Ktedonobacteraceae bacterium]